MHTLHASASQILSANQIVAECALIMEYLTAGARWNPCSRRVCWCIRRWPRLRWRLQRCVLHMRIDILSSARSLLVHARML